MASCGSSRTLGSVFFSSGEFGVAGDGDVHLAVFDVGAVAAVEDLHGLVVGWVFSEVLEHGLAATPATAAARSLFRQHGDGAVEADLEHVALVRQVER